MEKSVSIFDLLKQGTSFKQRPEKQLFETKKDNRSNSKPKEKQKPKPKVVHADRYGAQDSESEIEEEGIFHHNATTANEKKFAHDDDESEHEEEVDELTKATNRRRDRINKLLHQHRIKLEGEDVPYPVSNFSKMKKRYNLPDAMIENMKKSGYERPTPVQMQSVPILMKNRSLLSIAPTGSGKTLAYLIPLYCQLQEHQKGGCRAVIFVPTVELGEQILKEFLFFNLNIKNFLKVKFIHKITASAKAFQEQLNHTDVIITTPMKFIKLFEDLPDEITKIKHAMFDEADKYFELGFLDQVNTILEFLKVNTSIVYGWFSATINAAVDDILKNFLADPVKVIIGGRNNVLASIEQKLLYTGSEFGKLVEIRKMINQGGLEPPVLIFVQSKERATELYDELKTERIKPEVIHADKSLAEREDIVLRFRLGEIWVLITTDLMARGIDFKGVNLVINYDFPTSVISYVHRVGRTGRANRGGKAITFFTDFDKPLLKTLGNTLKASGLDVPDWILKLKKAGKDYRKKVEAIPIKRDAISLAPEKQADPRYKQEIKKVEQMYQKTIKRMKKNPESVPQGENDWVPVDQDIDDEGDWNQVTE